MSNAQPMETEKAPETQPVTQPETQSQPSRINFKEAYKLIHASMSQEHQSILDEIMKKVALTHEENKKLKVANEADMKITLDTFMQLYPLLSEDERRSINPDALKQANLENPFVNRMMGTLIQSYSKTKQMENQFYYHLFHP